MRNEIQKTATPPYVSYGVFRSTIEQLADSTVPTGPLDRRVLDGMSGADYGALISGLRFLGFVDDDRKATPEYRSLVQASQDAQRFNAQLLETLTDKYKPIVGKMDLQHGTITELEAAFKNYGVSQGQMLTKTVRFFVKALQACGVSVSPHITKPKPKTPRILASKNGDKSRANPASSSPASVQHPPTPTLPKGFERLPIPGLADAFIQYPANLTEAHCQLFDAMIGVLRTYVKARSDKEGQI